MSWVGDIDKHKQENAVMDVYALKNETEDKYYDACMLIFKDSMKFNNEIVSWVKQANLNANKDIKIDTNCLHHIETSSKLYEQPIIVGYKITNISEEGFNCFQSIKDLSQFERCLLDLNIKNRFVWEA
jgi:hypothetical protein